LSEPPNDAGHHRRSLLLAGAAVAVAGALAFTGITADKLWDDEANTGIFARNLLAAGRLTAWDGTNLIGYQDGAELDPNLDNVYMPPLQYWLAALGMAIGGQGELALRAPFVIAGLLCIAALGLLARRLAPRGFPWPLPVWLLALAPAFLLYIRNCRYYSPGAALTIALLACVAAPVPAGRSPWPRASCAAVCAALLMATSYLNAVGCVAAMALLFPQARLRNRRSVLVSVAALAGAASLGAYVLATANPLDAAVPRPDELEGLPRLARLMWLNLRDLATFEFFQVTLLPILALPFVLRRLAPARDTAKAALIVTGMMLVFTAATTLFSPQSASGSLVADMRYLVPIIPLGALVTAACLVILWRLWAPVAVVVGALAVLTNLPHLGFLGTENGYLPPRGVECTICQYVGEVFSDRTTSTEALVDYVEELPADAVLLIIPPFMAYSPMYYMPKRRFCCQLLSAHPLSEAMREELPDRLFWERAEADVALISAMAPASKEGPLMIRGVAMGYYRFVETLDLPPRDCSRPEIPWHSFDGEGVLDLPHHRCFVVTLEHR